MDFKNLDFSLIHQFKFGGLNILLDINSGSLFEIDEITFDVLELLKRKPSYEFLKETLKAYYKEEDIKEAILDIGTLKEKGLLFTQKEYEEDTSNLILKSLCLNVAHSCNFSCKYCFARQGDYGKEASLMSFEVAKKGIDFLHKNSLNRKNLEVDFFGGEPLLNWNVVKKTVEYAKNNYPDKKWRFTLTTNGYFIDEEKIQFFEENDISLVLSLDGEKEKNDLSRIFNNGKGTFNSIIDKIKAVAKIRNDGGYYVRGTYTKRTLNFSSSVKHIKEMGFKFISMEPVVLNEGELAITLDNLETLKNEYETLAKHYVETSRDEKWDFFHFKLDLEGGPCISKRIYGCGAGVEYLAVSPDGSIYPCHQFDGLEEFKMGDIFQKNLDLNIQEKFKRANFLFNKEECKTCFAKFYCSGGCLANNFIINKDIFKPYKIGCEIQKLRIEAALFIKAALL